MLDRLRAIAPYGVVLAIAAWLFHVSLQFPVSPRAGRLGPGIWPHAILSLTMFVCAIRIVFGLGAPRSGAAASDDGGLLEEVKAGIAHADEVPAPPPARHPLLLVIGIGLTIAYVALLGTLGFALATCVYLAAMMVVGRYRRPGVIAAVALAGSLAFMFVFMKVVYLSLPIGTAPFDAVSLALMKLMAIR